MRPPIGDAMVRLRVRASMKIEDKKIENPKVSISRKGVTTKPPRYAAWEIKDDETGATKLRCRNKWGGTMGSGTCDSTRINKARPPKLAPSTVKWEHVVVVDKTTAVILGRLRVIFRLLEVFGRNHAFEFVIVIDDQHFLDTVLVQQRFDFIVAGALGNRDQPGFRRHDLGHRRFHTRLETQVASRHDTDRALAIDDGHARYTHRMRQVDDFANRHVGRYCDRIAHDTAFKFLDRTDLARLLFDRHVLVNDADTAFLGQRDGQPGLSDGVHRRRQHRDIEPNPSRQLRTQVNLVGEHRRVSGLQENVVEREGFLGNTHESYGILVER